jgi:succinyl-CoA synthetase beta subunit
MKLFEYEAKDIAERAGLPRPKGLLAETPEGAREAFEAIGKPVVLKSQVLVAGRGKAGGIKFANSPEEAYGAAKALLGSEIKGEKVSKLLVEEMVKVKKELYVGFVINRASKRYSYLASTEGGVDIEEVAERSPEKIVRGDVDPLRGFQEYEARYVARKMGYRGRQLLELGGIIKKLHDIAVSYDGELIESNPLVETEDGSFIAADMKLIIDDNSLYRHKEYEARAKAVGPELTALEAKAKASGLAYVDLDGYVGIVGNGAGLTMATLDLVKEYGGEPANFCDMGGTATIERMVDAVEIVLSNPKTKALLMNVLGGIIKCDEVAKAVVKVKEGMGFAKPMVIRLVGTNEEEGKRILSGAGINSFDSMEEAAKRAVELARGA